MMEMLCPSTFKPRISPFELLVERARADLLARQTSAEKAAAAFFNNILRPEVSLHAAYAACARRREQVKNGGTHGSR